MTGGTENLSEDALEDIAYLARSKNRIEILATLVTGAHTSRNVEEATGASRSTVDRILSELEGRGWAERTTDGTYVATSAGEFAVTEFEPLVGAMQTLRTLGEAVAWLPDDEISIGLRHFQDATIRRSNPNSPVAEVTYLLELMRDATLFYNLTYIAPTLSLLQSMRDGVVERGMTVRNVLTADLITYLQDQDEQTFYWQEYIEGGARVYRYEGRIPCNVFIVDETVLIANNEPEAGHPCTFIETTNETVRTWAENLVETYREDAERLGPAAFSPERSATGDHPI